MAKNLLIVESPAKATTINRYLGEDFEVLASYGHIRDLPSKDGAVDTGNNFTMHYELSEGSKKHVDRIVKSAKKAEAVTPAGEKPANAARKDDKTADGVAARAHGGEDPGAAADSPTPTSVPRSA